MARPKPDPRRDPVDRRALATTAVLLAAGIGLDVVIGASIPGYAAAIGLIGCLVIIIGSKWLGTALIERPEDHYPDDVPPDQVEDLRG